MWPVSLPTIGRVAGTNLHQLHSPPPSFLSYRWAKPIFTVLLKGSGIASVIFVFVFVLSFFSPFETVTHYVALASLKFTM